MYVCVWTRNILFKVVPTINFAGINYAIFKSDS